MPVQFSSSVTQREMSWTAWKALFSDAGAQQHVEQDGTYVIWFYDGPEVYIARIWQGEVPADIVAGGYTQEQNDADKADFVANYLPTSNGTIQRVTRDGRLAVRTTAAEGTGKLFRLRALYFETASNTLVNKHPDGTSYGDAALTCFDAEGDVVTGDYSTAVRTVVDFEPTNSFELLGGWLDIDASIAAAHTDAWWVCVIAVPDIPAAYGGSIEFVQPLNLELIHSKRIAMDGRASTVMKYDPVNHTGKVRIAIDHPVGAVKDFQICLETFQ